MSGPVRGPGFPDERPGDELPGGWLRVAIDGPAGVGKTTSARGLAARLGFLYVDTGAMYRALALKALRQCVSVNDAAGAGALAGGTAVALALDGAGGCRVVLDGEDVTSLVRTPEVSDAASRIAVHAAVRERMVALQREVARGRSVVMEGRDIGTRVLPAAEVKVYLDATPGERARRRWKELESRGETVPLEAVLAQVRERDARDSGREVDPLRPAADAVIIDCTLLTLEAQLDAIMDVVRKAGRRNAPGGAAEETGPELR